MEKKLCPIHRYWYVGNDCPICRQEKMVRLSKRYIENSFYGNYGKETVSNEPTEESINKLLEKFNSH